MSKYIIDANVIWLAGTNVQDIPSDQLICAKKCLHFIKEFMDSASRLVLDAEGKILKEYRGVSVLKGSPNMAMEFCKWAHQHASDNLEDFIHLSETKENEFYPYPESEKLKTFDPPDRKYIALAYCHPQNPPIVEASDSKWWGIKEELKNNGIDIVFIDEEYIKNKYQQKIES